MTGRWFEPSSAHMKVNNAPMYANLYPTMRDIARAHGYALAVHGSMMRDMDVIAVPWTHDACDPQELVDAFAKAIAFDHVDDEPALKLHGRKVWTLAFPGTCFVDLSIMPMEERDLSTPSSPRA